MPDFVYSFYRAEAMLPHWLETRTFDLVYEGMLRYLHEQLIADGLQPGDVHFRHERIGDFIRIDVRIGTAQWSKDRARK